MADRHAFPQSLDRHFVATCAAVARAMRPPMCEPFLFLHSLVHQTTLAPERKGFALARKVTLRSADVHLESRRSAFCAMHKGLEPAGKGN